MNSEKTSVMNTCAIDTFDFNAFQVFPLLEILCRNGKSLSTVLSSLVSTLVVFSCSFHGSESSEMELS